MNGGLTGNIQNAPPIMYPHQMLVFNNELFVVGNFRYAGGVEVKRIAKWNGTEWVSPGFGFVPLNSNDYSFVHTFYNYFNSLIIAGGIKKIEFDDGTMDCGGIIQFSATGIISFEGGVTGNDIEAVMESPDENLLIGGGVFGNGYLGIMPIVDDVVELGNKNEINIFPNPASDFIFIKINNKKINGRLEIYIYSILGQKIKTENNVFKIDIADLKRGVYLMEIKNERGGVIAVGKFLKN